MKQVLVTILTAILSGLAPAAQALEFEEARHLLHRTGFGVTASEWQQIISLDYEDAVDRLLAHAQQQKSPAGPAWAGSTPLYSEIMQGKTHAERLAFHKKKREHVLDLTKWWLEEMLVTPVPLRERLTLFWSNHFVSSAAKSNTPMLLQQQNQLLREHAMGRFDEMTHAIIRDPAMLLYLDNHRNTKGSVNENLARELLELFTLGEGQYSEQDVKEAARCLTGWTVHRATGKFALRSKLHDSGMKSVLGKRGRFGGDELVDLLMVQPQTAERIVRKLWLEFISLHPDDEVVRQWAQEFREDDYAITPLLKTMFMSSAFRDPHNYGALIKSPTEFYVGLLRPAFDGLTREAQVKKIKRIALMDRLPRMSRQSGQTLFKSPSVSGWAGGTSWIDSKSLLAREQFARNLVLKLGSSGKRDDPYGTPIMKQGSAALRASDDAVLRVISAIDPLTPLNHNQTARRGLLDLISDPAIHLK